MVLLYSHAFHSGLQRYKTWLFTFLMLTLYSAAQAACDLPSNLAANTVTGSSATLTWTGTGNFYTIRHRIKTPQGPWLTSTATPTVKVIINLLPNTTYEYQIQAHCSGTPSTSGFTASSEFTTGDACAAPTGLSVYNIKSTSAWLGWTGPANASFYHTRIRLSSPQGPWINTTNAGNVKFYANLLPNTTYDFQVATQCVSDPAQSVYSNIITFTTCQAIISDFSLTTGANASSIPGTSCATEFIKDTAQSMYVEGCKNIALIADTSVGNTLGFTTICSEVTNFVDSSSNINYRFGKRKYSIAPTSDGKAVIVLFFTQDDFTHYNSALSTMDYLKLPTSGNQSDPAVANFRIAHIDSANNVSLSSPALFWDTTFHIWYTIIQRNNIKGTYRFGTMGACTEIVNFNLAVTNTTGHSTTATWVPVTTTPPGWYRFRIREINSSTWTLLGTSNYNVSTKLIQGLTPLTTYEVQMIKYCNSNLASPWSPSVVFTTPNTCYVPTGLNASNITATSAKLNWPAVPGAAYYMIRYKPTSNSSWTSGSVTGNSKTLVGLTPAKNYEYQVATHCTGSTITGPYSASAYFTTNASLRGLEETTEVEDGNQGFNLYPNPTQDELHVQFIAEQAQNYRVRLADLTGRTISYQDVQAYLGSNEITLSTQHLVSGLYFVQLLDGERVVYVARMEKQ